MAAETVSFTDFLYKSVLTSAALNSKFNALKSAVNNHAGLIDLGGGGVPAPSSYDLNPKDYGAIGDGSSHPLSETYGTLAEAQAVFPFVTALSQEKDYVAMKHVCNLAFGADGAEHADINAHLNRNVRVPAGNFVFGADELLIRNASGIKIIGAGKRATKFFGNGRVLAFDGLWYSVLADFAIQKQAVNGVPALDIDGNVPGHPYATRGVQGNTLQNIFVDAGWDVYAFAICRQGGSGGQGSENSFHNVHLSSATEALYFQNGYNALANVFYGGNFQGYTKHGAFLLAGSIMFIMTGFQSTTGYTQVINGGFDIHAASGGVADRIIVIGTRTESLRHYKGAGSQTAIIDGALGTPSVYVWTAGAVVPLNTVVIRNEKLYRVTVSGTSAGAEPVWPATGTVMDGTVEWTQTPLDWIDIAAGEVRSALTQVGGIRIEKLFDNAEVTADYIVKQNDRVVYVDATAGPVTVTLPADSSAESPTGRQVIVKKADTSANAVTVNQADGGFVDFNPAPTTIPGGSRGALTFMQLGGGIVSRRWVIVGKV